MTGNPNMRGELRHNEAMSLHNSWRAGGPADRWYRPADAEDLALFIRDLPDEEPLLWLGLGSNLLVRDGGFRGTVIALHGVLDQIQEIGDGRLRIEAGVHCARLAKYCAERGLDNAGFFIGIPGTVGGALAMNAGAYGGETWQQVDSVTVLDRRGETHHLQKKDFDIGYRSVKVHAKTGMDQPCYLSAEMHFQAGDADTCKARIKQLLNDRRAAQPVGQLSCGSVFTNPPGDHAARLIESAGLKGEAIGKAQVSDKHANFIVNTGDAAADDIEDLIARVQARVEEVHGVTLHTEVRIVGERGHA